MYKLGELFEIEVLAISTFEDSLLKTIVDNFIELIAKKNQVLTLDLNPYFTKLELFYWRFNLWGFRKKKRDDIIKIILTEINRLKDNLKENI
ncbi:hypothetical protein CHY_1921 [Carboxydothermus hydrogenoformans Z-2901]|uniref:Uncharacterized protein n=1 Tax=Carboxydothermus hydrogenoformans (strain ATCC BAA-161 / DSM 6008 / Z-2901) TaxID=246194 RepID=Q3AAU4_CARHZ|nr:hypothetical protein CHY_1921 [Carboxydothermus hydrogenoformans Z-2901]